MFLHPGRVCCYAQVVQQLQITAVLAQGVQAAQQQVISPAHDTRLQRYFMRADTGQLQPRFSQALHIAHYAGKVIGIALLADAESRLHITQAQHDAG